MSEEASVYLGCQAPDSAKGDASDAAGAATSRVRRRIEAVGKTFGRLTVTSELPLRAGRRRMLCSCECGNTAEADFRYLRSGRTSSCGCVRKETLVTAVRSRMKFPVPRTNLKEYKSWQGMKARCSNPTLPGFHNYGGRGIRVCKRWQEDFVTFLEDMGPKPSDEYSIDRINVNGNYSPENCRWATPKEQALNKRAIILVQYAGEEIPLTEACRLAGIKYRCAQARLKRGKDWLGGKPQDEVGPQGPSEVSHPDVQTPDTSNIWIPISTAPKDGTTVLVNVSDIQIKKGEGAE